VAKFLAIRSCRFNQSFLKLFVIEGKNFLFANTPSEAKGSAVIFSLIQTALNNNLDPWRYLTWLMQRSDTTEDMEALLPWNTPLDCRVSL
ncbi:MAG: transposase domain-containing protein, partial [Oscillospiraceae bacterium]|nr:transposase domain-containing protein [Oscillospiraceae bacterium]